MKKIVVVIFIVILVISWLVYNAFSTDYDAKYQYLFEKNAVIVSVDKNNKLIDVVDLSADSRTSWIWFEKPKNIDEQKVFVIGTNVHKDLNNNWYFTGDKGVTVKVEDGKILSVSGNGMGMPAPINNEVLEAVKSKLIPENFDPQKTTHFTYDMIDDKKMDSSKSWTSHPQQKEIEKALQALVDRNGEDSFVIIEEPKSKKFIQFSVDQGDLLFDFPEMDDESTNKKAKLYFQSVGIEFPVINEYIDPETEKPFEAKSYQLDLYQNVDIATRFAIRVIRNVHGIGDTVKLTFQEN